MGGAQEANTTTNSVAPASTVPAGTRVLAPSVDVQPELQTTENTPLAIAIRTSGLPELSAVAEHGGRYPQSVDSSRPSCDDILHSANPRVPPDRKPELSIQPYQGTTRSEEGNLVIDDRKPAKTNA